jgi:histone H3/H4
MDIDQKYERVSSIVEEGENQEIVETTTQEEEQVKRRAPPRRKRETVIPRVCFSRLVKDLALEFNGKTIWSHKAMQLLQEYTETYLTKHFHVSNELAGLCKKRTITRDIFEFIEKNKQAIMAC